MLPSWVQGVNIECFARHGKSLNSTSVVAFVLTSASAMIKAIKIARMSRGGVGRASESVGRTRVRFYILPRANPRRVPVPSRAALHRHPVTALDAAAVPCSLTIA